MEEEITIEETTKDGSTWTVVRKGCQTLLLKNGAFYGVRETGSGINPRSITKEPTDDYNFGTTFKTVE